MKGTMNAPEQTQDPRYIDGLLNALTQQRDAALNSAAQLAARMTVMAVELAELKAAAAAAPDGQDQA